MRFILLIEAPSPAASRAVRTRPSGTTEARKDAVSLSHHLRAPSESISPIPPIKKRAAYLTLGDGPQAVEQSGGFLASSFRRQDERNANGDQKHDECNRGSIHGTLHTTKTTYDRVNPIINKILTVINRLFCAFNATSGCHWEAPPFPLWH